MGEHTGIWSVISNLIDIEIHEVQLGAISGLIIQKVHWQPLVALLRTPSWILGRRGCGKRRDGRKIDTMSSQMLYRYILR